MPPTWNEGVAPTTEQLVEWFMSLTSTDKLKWMGRTQLCLDLSSKCLQWDHEGRVAQLEQALVKASDTMNDLQTKVEALSSVNARLSNRQLMADIKDAEGHE